MSTNNPSKNPSKNPYADAGVNVAQANAFAQDAQRIANAQTFPGAIPTPNGFAGLFNLAQANATGTTLAASTDGVGTKILPLFRLGLFETAGRDLAAMSLNDVLAQGARPLFFLDYIAMGKLNPDAARAIVHGVAQACRQAHCALIGGETAEMPGVYPEGEGDLAGFCVGTIDDGARLPTAITPGDALIGVASSGPHANGFSLIRRLVPDAAAMDDLGLLEPTRNYVPAVLALRQTIAVKGMAHITGGGLVGNVGRMWSGLGCSLTLPPLPKPFALLRERLAAISDTPDAAMAETFNCGVGLVIALADTDADAALALLHAQGETAMRLGVVNEGGSVDIAFA